MVRKVVCVHPQLGVSAKEFSELKKYYINIAPEVKIKQITGPFSS